MSQYDELDAAIVRVINSGVDTASRMEIALSDQLSDLAKASGKYTFRVLDARLQTLRKKGRIRFGAVSRKWLIGGDL